MKIPSHIPFKVHRFRFFYGWVIMIAGVIGILMSIPGQTMGVSAFTDYLKDALRIERSQLSLAYLIGTILSGTLITRAGRIYDIHGARIMAIIAGILLGAGLIFLARIPKISQAILSSTDFVSHDTTIMVLLVIGFFLIRFFGQGILTMVSRNMVMKWFEKRRGLVNGIMGVFVSFGFAASPQLFNSMIDYSSWSLTWIYLGIFAITLFSIIVFVLFRDNPHDCQLIPDGKIIFTPSSGKRPRYKPDKEYTKAEAVKTYSYWVFTAALFMNALIITAVTFHIVSLFDEANLTRQNAVSIFIPASMVAVATNLFGGYISDYIRLKYVLMANILGMLLSCMGAALLGVDESAKLILIIGNGIISGSFSILISITWPRFYGTKHLGEVSGFALSWTVYGSAIGPYFFSLSLKYLHSYQPILYMCIAVCVALLLMAVKADNVNEKRN